MRRPCVEVNEIELTVVENTCAAGRLHLPDRLPPSLNQATMWHCSEQMLPAGLWGWPVGPIENTGLWTPESTDGMASLVVELTGAFNEQH